MLSYPESLDQDQAIRLKAQWKQAQQTRDVAVVSGGLTFTPMAWSPSDTQLLDARRFTVNEIALIFGLDPTWLGAAQSRRVYSNVETEGINLVRYSLGGHLARFEQALSAALPSGTYVKANLDGLLRADTLSRYQTHEIGIQAGFRSRDEARELEDRPPLTPKQRAELLPSRAENAPRPAPQPRATATRRCRHGEAGEEQEEGRMTATMHAAIRDDAARPRVRARARVRSAAKGGDGRTVEGICVPYRQRQRIDDSLVEMFAPGRVHPPDQGRAPGPASPATTSRTGGAIIGKVRR